MLCREMARQIAANPIVRAGIRITPRAQRRRPWPRGPLLGLDHRLSSIGGPCYRRGRPFDTIDPPMFARFVIGAFTGVQTVSQVLTHRTDLEQRVDEMWGFLLPGIMPIARHPGLMRIRAARTDFPSPDRPAVGDNPLSAPTRPVHARRRPISAPSARRGDRGRRNSGMSTAGDRTCSSAHRCGCVRLCVVGVGCRCRAAGRVRVSCPPGALLRRDDGRER
jgi:hypothetical protein